MNETLKDSIARALVQEEPTIEPTETAVEETPKRKPRKRHSLIERTLLPGDPTTERPKRTRRKKDPALKKSHSFTILLTEQTYQKFKQVAEAQELSMNGIVGRLIKKYIILHDIDGENLDI